MKIFISADLEGCAGVTSWSETTLGNAEHYQAAEEMTMEVKAACEGLMEAGVKEIIVKDAHDSGKNIFHEMLPTGVRVIREWTGSPYSMVQGLDASFDGAIFLGYHAAASMIGNPLSHTMDTKAAKIILNDMICSEYLLHAYAAADFSVPVMMISGDQMICEWAQSFNPHMITAPMKEGLGAAVLSLNRTDATDLIRKQAFNSIKRIDQCHIKMPASFSMSIIFHQHIDALRASYYPGVVRTGPYEVNFQSKSIYDLLTTRMFIL